MRRVYDDEKYDKLSKQIMDVLTELSTHADDVRRYNWGMRRSMRDKIQEYLVGKLPKIKFGQYVNHSAFGNNAAYEMVYDGSKKEQQIFGILHLTDNMYGRHICWMTDIDGERGFESVVI